MSSVFTATADLLQLADGNISDIDVNELLEEVPLLAAMSAIVASNETSHEWLKKTAAPAVGFRAINNGTDNAKATYTKVTQALALFDASFAIDVGLLRASGGDALRMREAKDHLMAAFSDMEKQIIYGTVHNGAGFSGLGNQAGVDALADPMVVNAAGTTVGGGTSVWAIRTGDTAVSVVYGGGGRIEIGEEYPTTLAGSSVGVFDAMRTPILFWGGVQVATSLDLGRIANLTVQATRGLTDGLIATLLSRFPAGRGPSVLVMSRQSLAQLQASRTPTTPGGLPAPFPTESFGVPIIVSDSVRNTEAIVA